MRDDGRFHVGLAMENGAVTGFVTYWNLGRFNYIEHLAVDTPARHRGTGSALVEQVKALGLPVLLEVEPPVDAVTVARVDFYRRLGFELWREVDYLQPPYSPGKPAVPLCIMTTAGMTLADVQAAIAVLHAQVYRYQVGE